MKPKPLHTGDMEVALARFFNYRVYTIVPNVSYGFGLNHECDLLLLDKKLRLTEVEIKISRSDLRADFKKTHGHRSRYISRLIYAVTEDILDTALEIVPKENGIVVVKQRQIGNPETGHVVNRCEWVRQCQHDKTKQPITESRALELTRLGCMRIWSLKEKNNRRHG
jgi:hypothetical protein